MGTGILEQAGTTCPKSMPYPCLCRGRVSNRLSTLAFRIGTQNIGWSSLDVQISTTLLGASRQQGQAGGVMVLSTWKPGMSWAPCSSGCWIYEAQRKHLSSCMVVVGRFCRRAWTWQALEQPGPGQGGRGRTGRPRQWEKAGRQNTAESQLSLLSGGRAGRGRKMEKSGSPNLMFSSMPAKPGKTMAENSLQTALQFQQNQGAWK